MYDVDMSLYSMRRVQVKTGLLINFLINAGVKLINFKDSMVMRLLAILKHSIGSNILKEVFCLGLNSQLRWIRAHCLRSREHSVSGTPNP